MHMNPFCFVLFVYFSTKKEVLWSFGGQSKFCSTKLLKIHYCNKSSLRTVFSSTDQEWCFREALETMRCAAAMINWDIVDDAGFVHTHTRVCFSLTKVE